MLMCIVLASPVQSLLLCLLPSLSFQSAASVWNQAVPDIFSLAQIQKCSFGCNIENLSNAEIGFQFTAITQFS